MKKLDDAKIYLYLVLIFGVIMVFITPPFQSPDEDSHFKKAYQISNGHLYSSVKNNKIGNVFPDDMNKYIDKKLKYIGNRDKKYSYSEMVEDQYLKMNYNKKHHSSYATSTIFPFVYVAPAFGIVCSKIVAHIFGFDMITTSYMLYFARILCLIFASVITYYAIKKTPVFKKTFAVVGLLPMVVFLNSMVTYDSVLISLSLLALSIILKWTFESTKEFSKKEFIILILIGTVLLNVKILYFFLYMLMFLIPAKKFKNIKGKCITAGIMVASIILLSFIIKLPYLLQHVSGGSSLVSKQMAFVLNNPINYLGILLNNIWMQRQFQLVSMVGLFGLIDTYIPIVVVFVIYTNLVLIALSEGSSDKKKISVSMKALSIIYILIAIFIVFTSMYILWTPELYKVVGGSNITGVQGRYFIPLIMPFMLIFSNKLFKDNKFFKSVRNNYILVPVIALIISSIIILLRYWV